MTSRRAGPGAVSGVVEDYFKTYATDEGGNMTSIKAILLAKAGKEQEAEEAIHHASAAPLRA